jgi:hypothetical protein
MVRASVLAIVSFIIISDSLHKHDLFLGGGIYGCIPMARSLEEDSSHIGKGRGGANSDILTPSSLLEEVERHFPHLTISNNTIANGIGRSASVARAQNDDCTTLHPHVHFTPDYSDMSAYEGPFADGKNKRTFLNRQGKVVRGSYGNTYKFNNKPNGV